MSRYYFHIRDGQFFVPDEEGMECRNMVAVQDEARASVHDLINAALLSFARQHSASIEIEDEDGNCVQMMATGSWLH